MVTRVLGGGAILHLVATHSWVENAALWRQEWEGPYHTIPGGTTQERRGPEGHNFQPRNPPEKESRARRYRVHAGTVWQVSDVRRLYVRCQIFQWAGPWCQMTGVWGDRRMSDDFTRNGSGIGPSSWILDRTLDVDAGPGNHCCQCLHKGCFSRWDLNMVCLSEV